MNVLLRFAHDSPGPFGTLVAIAVMAVVVAARRVAGALRQRGGRQRQPDGGGV